MFKATLKYNKLADLRRVGVSARKEILEFRRQILGEVCVELMETTPIKTGRAAMGWSAGVKLAGLAIPELKSSKLDRSMMTKGEKESVIIERSNSISIENQVPYIAQLELGSSTQAPSGFVKASISRGMSNLNNGISKMIKKAMKEGRWGGR